MTEVTVGAAHAGQRLDNFLLARYRGLPRSLVYRWLRQGAARLNRRRAKPSTRVQEGDLVRVPPVHDLPQPAAPARPGPALVRELAARVLHEDAALLVMDKPSGLACHGGSGLRLGLIEALRAARPELRELELVHRLDRETSGCLLVAKRRSLLRALHAALREGQVGKQYLALLCGDLPAERTVEAPLKRALRGGERLMTVAADGQSARTVFLPLERFGDYTLVQVRLDTGRMHQIRVHALSLGLPVAGDPRYGGGEAPPGLQRLFLHARDIELPALGGQPPRSYRAPLPAALRQVLETLRERPAPAAATV